MCMLPQFLRTEGICHIDTGNSRRLCACINECVSVQWLNVQ